MNYSLGNSNNLWFDFDSIESLEEFLRVHEEVEIFETSTDETFWKELARYEDLYGYKREKYRSRQAFYFEFLLPKSVAPSDLHSFVCELVKRLKHGCSLNYQVYRYQKGEGTYLKILFAERKLYEKEKSVNKVETRDRYVNRTTKKICKESDPDAVLIRTKGTVYGTKMIKWSDKYRIFITSKKYFNYFRQRIKRMFAEICVKVNVEFKKINFFTSIKRKSSYNKYTQQNITLYNGTVAHLNMLMKEIHEMLNSGGKYSQWSKNIDRVNTLFYRYKQRLSKEKFRYNENVVLSLNIYIRVDWFRQNINEFVSSFEKDWCQVWNQITGAEITSVDLN